MSTVGCALSFVQWPIASICRFQFGQQRSTIMSKPPNHSIHCDVCGKDVPLSQSVPAALIRPSVTESVLKDHPNWTSQSHICLQDLNRYRSLYVQQVLETERGELSSLEQEVVESLREHELLAANANEEFDSNVTFGERIADGVAKFGGSWTFIIIFGVVRLTWLVVNISWILRLNSVRSQKGVAGVACSFTSKEDPMRLVGYCILLSLLSGDVASADQQQPASPFVLGYADKLSCVAGEEISFHLSSSGDSVRMVIERHGGTNETVFQKADIACETQPIPDRASSHGCGWPAAMTMTIPDDWKSGCYVATLILKTGEQETRNTIQFVVRAAVPGKNTKMLLQLATNTYNAYTNWGGHSLYSYHDRGGLQGHRVSFDRPLQSQYSKWELPFAKWAENNGYVIDYAVNSDLEHRPEILKQYRLVLSVGHDEYWSADMRDNLEKYIADGGNVAFLSGNTCCWQVRSEDNGRALTCWKQSYNVDPLFRTSDHKLLSTAWSHHLVERPENQLTGVGFLWGGYHRSHGQFMDGPASYIVHRPDHWLFAGTDLKLNDRFGGKDTVVGYECDGCEMTWKDGLPFPTGRDGTPDSFTILGSCPARWAPGDSLWYDRFPEDRVGAAVLGVYTQGGTVVTAGSTDWAHGLSGGDPSSVRITRNILDRLSK